MNRWGYIIAGTLALIVLVLVGGMHLAARSIKSSILEALGPQGEAAEINVRLTSIELVDVRIAAPKTWPTDTALRARRVVVIPDMRHLLSDHVEVTRIEIEDAYLSALRPQDGGGLRVLPSLVERAKKKKRDAEERRGATVDTVALSGSTIEVFDATVPGKAQKVRLDAVKGTVKDIQVPELRTRTRVDLDAAVKGVQRNGTVKIDGWVEVARKDAELTTTVRNVDLALFEPYLISKTKSGIDSGTFSLDLKSRVQSNNVNATGTLTVNALKLKASDSPIGAISGLPRRAAIGALEDEQGQITVPFTLAGNLDDPTFSLTGDTALQTGVAVAKAFGMSFEGIARAFLIIVNGLGGAFGALVPG
jgi:hypothetical protein